MNKKITLEEEGPCDRTTTAHWLANVLPIHHVMYIADAPPGARWSGWGCPPYHSVCFPGPSRKFIRFSHLVSTTPSALKNLLPGNARRVCCFPHATQNPNMYLHIKQSTIRRLSFMSAQLQTQTTSQTGIQINTATEIHRTASSGKVSELSCIQIGINHEYMNLDFLHFAYGTHLYGTRANQNVN